MTKQISSPLSSSTMGTNASSRPEMLIATLGRSSQVGTRTFDELFFKRKIPLTHVVWIHSRDDTPLMQKSIERVRHEVEHYYKQREESRDVVFEFVTITGRDNRRPTDTRTREDAEAVLYTLHEQLTRWKGAGYSVHLSISGGAKVLAAFGVAAAQLTFDSEEDKCWHLVAQNEVTRHKEMHVVPDVVEDEVRLIPVPVLRWKTWKELPSRSVAEAISQDPLHAQDIVSQLRDDEMFKWRRQFVEHVLKQEEERPILEALSLYGLENEEIDHTLHVNCKNVISRIWRKYCEFIHAKAMTGSCNHTDVVQLLNAERLRRGRLIADFHLVFKYLQAKKHR